MEGVLDFDFVEHSDLVLHQQIQFESVAEAWTTNKQLLEIAICVIRSHAQKYLKVQKSGGNEHLPPPRPKRKAAHPYPQKASKSVPHLPLMMDPVHSSASVSLPKPGYLVEHDVPDASRGDLKSTAETAAANSCSSAESTPRVQTLRGMPVQADKSQAIRVLPDFAQVYGFIGSVFDPNVTGHLQNLKQMDPIDVETVLLLMRNLSINLTSPDFEDHVRKYSQLFEDHGTEEADRAWQLSAFRICVYGLKLKFLIMLLTFSIC